ncbi:MAG: molybdopterin-dependent oxidoreductase [Proteobacteria bacterium]|nr:molybdopterin-dependent oxidoreductase [Pseudomonadota bacterium]
MNRRDERILLARGEARFVDDVEVPADCLFAAPVPSPAAAGEIVRIETGAAAAAPDVVAVLTAADVPGENQIGAIIQDEPLLAAHEVDCVGQPVALVVARSAAAARAAAKLVAVEVHERAPVLDPREAFARGMLIAPPRTIASGDVEKALAAAAVVVEGRCDTGGQEHVYLETQGALATPTERGGVHVRSSTQSPSGVQRGVARVLGVPMHDVEVDVLRLGGGFGGKEDQATAYAAMAALAAVRVGRPVKLVLSRGEDMRLTGKRHPYSADFRIGLDAGLAITAYEVTFYQSSGAAADLSTAILERTLLHATGSYRVPNVRATATPCRTNVAPNTAFRGFGGPQAMFVMEAAIHAAARKMGVPARAIQERNLIGDGDRFPYGMVARGVRARQCFAEACTESAVAERARLVEEHNRSSCETKRGLAVMPVCFGISFTNTMLNQASALVHVYVDGSVGVSAGAVEMGQGVRAKLRRIAATALGVDLDSVKVESTNTTRTANVSPTAASTGADMNGQAVRMAAEALRARLAPVAAAHPGASFSEIAAAAHAARVSLTAQAHYATPGIHFDREKNQGAPFAYHVCGTAIAEVTLDCLRGTYRVDSVRIVHDVGSSLDPGVDLGQVEGALVQGLGWLLLEELRWNGSGRLLTDTLGTYKLPDVDFAPRDISVRFLEGDENRFGAYGSKAIGEPPLMYAIAAYFALVEAIRAAREDAAVGFETPLTPEKVFMALAGGNQAR